MNKCSKCEIDTREQAECLAEAECKKTCSDLATELFKSRGKQFCVGLVLHLTMHISDSYK